MNKSSLILRILVKFLVGTGIYFAGIASIEAALKNPFESQLPAKTPEPSEKIIRKTDPVRPESPRPSLRPSPSLRNDPRPEVSLPQLTVSGIVWNSKRPQAIINQQVVDIGDEFDGVKIINIRKTAIDIMFQGQEITIQP